jgi:hypothetical protein
VSKQQRHNDLEHFILRIQYNSSYDLLKILKYLLADIPKKRESVIYEYYFKRLCNFQELIWLICTYITFDVKEFQRCHLDNSNRFYIWRYLTENISTVTWRVSIHIPNMCMIVIYIQLVSLKDILAKCIKQSTLKKSPISKQSWWYYNNKYTIIMNSIFIANVIT